ncbi:MAG: hypothetical protein M1820_007276 [Bogoriella megaspora]|nr:MAG: hypothetical protein M1820_007276 [Bogoriella megaspora]
MHDTNYQTIESKSQNDKRGETQNGVARLKNRGTNFADTDYADTVKYSSEGIEQAQRVQTRYFEQYLQNAGLGVADTNLIAKGHAEAYGGDITDSYVPVTKPGAKPIYSTVFTELYELTPEQWAADSESVRNKTAEVINLRARIRSERRYAAATAAAAMSRPVYNRYGEYLTQVARSIRAGTVQLRQILRIQPQEAGSGSQSGTCPIPVERGSINGKIPAVAQDIRKIIQSVGQEQRLTVMC